MDTPMPPQMQAPSLEEMIALRKAQAILKKAETALLDKGYTPMQTGMGSEGEAVLFAAKYNIDIEDASNSHLEFAWAGAASEEDTPEVQPVAITVTHTATNERGFPLYSFTIPSYNEIGMGDFGFYTQVLHFVEALVSELGMVAQAVKLGQAPRELLQNQTTPPEPKSQIILPS